MAFTKPNVNTPWGFQAGDGILEPLPAKIAQGWVAEIPDFEFENWIQNRQDVFNAHVNERGIPEWDGTTNYLADKSYVQDSNGIVYRSLTNNVNKEPSISPSDWQRAFNVFDSSYSKTESDNLFLTKAGNLAGLTNKATARSTLNVYSKVESDAAFQISSQLSSMIVAFPVSTPPSGWLACDGSAVNRSTYPTLFARIGTSFGSGDGSTTFNVPNLENEFIRGASAGRVVGSIEQDAIKSHNHTGSTNTTGNHSHTGSISAVGDHRHNINAWKATQIDSTGGSYAIGGDAGAGGSQQADLITDLDGGHSHSLTINSNGNHSHSFTTDSTGGSETRPRNIAMLYCIKT